MSFKLPKLRYLNTILLTLTIILGSFGLYFLFYFKGQTTYFTNRNLRLLLVLKTQIQSKVDVLGNAYKKAAQSATEAYLPDQPAHFRLDGYLRPIVNDGNDIEPDSLRLLSPAPGQEVVTYDLKQESGAKWLVFDYTGVRKNDATDVSKKSAINFRVKGKFEDLFGSFIHKLVETDAFESVLIADYDGNVIYEKGASELGVTSLKNLIKDNEEPVKFDLLRQNSNVFEAHIAQTKYKVFIQPVSLAYARTNAQPDQNSSWIVCGLVSSRHFHSESAAISYTILISLTFLAIVVALSAPFLRLLFMRPQEKVRVADVYFLAFSALVGTALVTTYLIYSFSYWTLENQVDDQLTSFATKIKTNFDHELRDANRQLVGLNKNEDVQKRMKYLSQLDQAKQGVGQKNRGPVSTSSQTLIDPNKELDKLDKIDRQTSQNFNHPSDQGWKNNYGCPKPKRCSGQTGILGQLIGYQEQYPYLHSVSWIDKDGQQRIKWTISSDLTPFVSVQNRPYFRAIADGRPWEFAYEDTDEETDTNTRKVFKYFVEPVYSMTTGGQLVILSAPASRPENESHGQRWVSAMDIRPISLMHAILPTELGYGYCVIDNEGKVLFHSDQSRNLFENLFVETDNDDYLRSVVLANESGLVTLRYQGVGHRLYVTPLANTPWTLITFRDKQVLRISALQLIAYAIFLFVVYALLLLVLFSVYHLWKTVDRPAIAWPYSKRAENYYLSITVNLILAFIFVIAIFVVGELVSLAIAVLFPVSAFFFHHWNLKKGPKLGKFGTAITDCIEQSTPLDYRSGYILAQVTLLLLVSVLPMLTFFKVAYDREMSLYVKLGQLSYASGLQERAEKLHLQYLQNGHSTGVETAQSAIEKETRRQNLATFLRKRLSFDNAGTNSTTPYSDLYGDFFFNTKFSLGDETLAKHQVHTNQLEALTQLIPIGNAIGSRAPGLNSGMLQKELDHDGRVVLHTVQGVDAAADHKVLHIESDGPKLGKDAGYIWWTGLVTMLLLIGSGLFVLVGFVGRRLFLLNTNEPVVSYRADLSLANGSRNLVVLGPSSIRMKALNRKHFEVLDLRAGSKESWVEMSKALLEKPVKKPIAINYFESEWDDPVANREKIRLVDSLLRHDKRLFVFSTVNLLEFAYEQANGNGADDNGDLATFDNLRRTRVFTAFAKFYLEDNDEHNAFGKRISSFEAAWIGQETRTRKEITHIRKLLQTLEEECGGRVGLQSVGDEILSSYLFEHFTPEQVQRSVHDKAHYYYHTVWDTCSRDEKLTLYNLARYRFVNSHNPDLPRLLRRGLIIREPYLRLMNKSFTRFVIEETNPAKLASWKREDDGGGWEMLRIPFFVILFSAAAFLFVSQRELYNSAFAVVSALAVAMPTVFKVMGMFSAPTKT